ncbi:MAG: PD-(D/E)XK nuclease family protein [Candidatus Pacebacteria bacterium]|jgi:CRISPR/Cas system-associated exonuclease Cas4 (RecB family)|nr:PD-(D/E)XK nuclease family protein [Candidatus Paceibacterota bacterium]|tara:strand:+ start:54143 stop:54934 length:792 start_codon:yes stop_codon:yes gene_type:complete
MTHFDSAKKRNIYNPSSSAPFKISRTKIDFFLECPRCFYLDQRLGVKRPSIPGFTLNIAVDHLLKKEFDIHRVQKSKHPLMESYDIDAIPFENEKLNDWRNNFTGVQCHYKLTNFLVFGAIDDVWVNPQGELLVVDYKATSKKEKPTLEGRWGGQYKRQMEVYQWLFRCNGFKVSDTGYFVYVNGKKDREAFDGKLEFDIDVISYKGDSSWIEKVLGDIKKTLESDEIPAKGELCEHCPYREDAGKILLKKHREEKKELGKLF